MSIIIQGNTNFGSNIITDGLVFYYDIANPKSYPRTGTSIYDLSNTHNDGTLIGTIDYSSEYSGILSPITGGGNDYFSISETNYPEWTIDTWYKANVEDMVNNGILYFTSNDSTKTGRISISSGTFFNLNGIVEDSENNIYVAGEFVKYNDIQRRSIMKLSSDGTIDLSFDRGIEYFGAITISMLSISTGDTIYYCGTNVGGINELNSDGSLSQNINLGNMSAFYLDEVHGKIYGGGPQTSVQGYDTKYLTKLNVIDFTVDPTFITGTNSFDTATIRNILVDANEKVYVTGAFTTYSGISANGIIRLNSDATIDTGFTYGTGFAGGLISTNCMRFDSNGKIYIAGDFTSYNGTSANRIIRLNTDGSIDTGFTYGTGFNDDVFELKLDSNDKVYCIGRFSIYNNTSANRIIRLNTDGSIDTDFTYGTGFNNVTSTIGVLNNNKVVVGSTVATSYNGTPFNHLIKLNTDGSIDTGFTSNNGITSITHRINTYFYYKNNLGVNVSQLLFIMGGSTRGYFTTLVSKIGVWNNLTITMDDTQTLSFYHNGEFDSSFDYATAQSVNLQINRIFGKTDFSTIKIYNRALLDTEIANNYEYMRRRYYL